MDLTSIGASIATAVVTLSSVSIYLKRYGPKAYQALKLADAAICLSEDVIEATKDDVITPEELMKFQADAKVFRIAYDNLKKK